MDVTSDERLSELLQAETHVWNQTFNFIKSASLKCAVELGIADVIHKHGKPMTLSQLLMALPTVNPAKVHAIRRLMRLLLHSGFFVQQKVGEEEEEEEEGYQLTPSARLLLKDEPFNARALLLLNLDQVQTKPWLSLSDWFQNDEPTAFVTTYGMSFWDYATREARIGDLFNEAMARDSYLITKVLINHCKEVFSGLNSLVDVGGGTGTVARALTDAFPNLKCTVFDLPHTVANLQGNENLKFVGGDMLKAIPPADAIFLKWILHNWGDQDCVKILKRCREALPSEDKGGKVIIIDVVMENQKAEDDKSVETQLFFHMLMMTFLAGKERNEKEWEKLFLEAGFSRYKITPVLGLRSLIEVYP